MFCFYVIRQEAGYTAGNILGVEVQSGFIKNYPLASHAISANSEIFNEARMLGLMDYGKINIEYDANGNTIEVKENKYSRLYNNLENIPKLAEYMSLKEKYMKQARKDFEAGR